MNIANGKQNDKAYFCAESVGGLLVVAELGMSQDQLGKSRRKHGSSEEIASENQSWKYVIRDQKTVVLPACDTHFAAGALQQP